MNTLSRVCLFLFSLITVWQALIFWFDFPDYFLPSPFQVSQALYRDACLLALHALPTVLEILVGLVLGISTGIFVAMLISVCPPLAIFLLPIIVISQAIPTFAIAPLIVVWFGYGLTSKVIMTMLLVFFPVSSALYDGLRRTNPAWMELAKSVNSSAWRTFCFIRFPAALPSLCEGIRIATVAAPIGALVGEWVGASRGLGYFMLNANARLQIDQMFAALIIFIFIALTLYFVMDQILRKLIWWQQPVS